MDGQPRLAIPEKDRKMKKHWITLVGSATVLSSLGLGACSGDDPDPLGPPIADCTPTDPACPALSVESNCLALVDNQAEGADSGPFAMRISQLSVTAPEALTGPAVYKIVADGVNINLPSCNISGLGTFSWISVFDRDNGVLKTGGALPEADPTDGYCFDYDAEHSIAPATVATTYGADGAFETEAIPAITVPIYLDLAASSAVYLPLRQVRLLDGTISPDNNCIGSYNAKGLEPINSCKPDLSNGIEYFLNGAKLEGYIELEEADTVEVDTIGQTLCVLLSGNATMYGEPDPDGPTTCKRDPDTKEILFEGDWCSTTDSAGGCKDAVRLLAGLAASAVSLRDDCETGGGGGSGGMSATGSGGAGGAGDAGGAGGG